MQPYPYNRDRRKGPGVFNNAVFSKVVHASDDPSVRKGVDDDLRSILEKSHQNKSDVNSPRLVNLRSPINLDQEKSFSPKVPKIRMPGRGLKFLRKRDDMVVRRMPRDYDEARELPKKPRREPLDLINNFSDFVAENSTEGVPKREKRKKVSNTVRFNPSNKAFEFDDAPADDFFGYNLHEGTSFAESEQNISLLNSFDNRQEQRQKSRKKPLTPEMTALPKALPMKEVVARTAEAIPKLTLRKGHPLSYSTLVSDICRRSLLRSQRQSTQESEDTQGSQESQENQENTSEQLMSYLNTTVHRAAVENDEELDELGEPPFELSYSVESPLPIQSRNNAMNETINSQFRTPSPSGSNSTPPRVDEDQSLGFSLIFNKKSEFDFPDLESNDD